MLKNALVTYTFMVNLFFMIPSFFPKITMHITRPSGALDRRSLYVPGFQRQVFKRVQFFSERSEESKERKKNKGSVLIVESAYNAQNAKFGLVMQINVWQPKEKIPGKK